MVVGSIVIDTIFDLSSNIKDHINIKDGSLGVQNLMFTAFGKKEFFGGTGANIAYGLGLLKQNPILTSVVGRDFEQYYKKHLKNVGVDLKILEDKENFSANFYVMSDSNNEQVGIFLPNAYGIHAEKIPLSKFLSTKDFSKIGVGIFSAGTAKSITSHLAEFKKSTSKDSLAIFDPGQILMPMYNKDLLKKSLENADILIGNEVEILQIKNHFGFSFEEIFELGVTNIIETQGEKGSILHTRGFSKLIPANKVKKVVDPTGAGDAFRSGLIYGLLNDMGIEESMKIGSIIASESIKYIGGQAYSIPKKT